MSIRSMKRGIACLQVDGMSWEVEVEGQTGRGEH